MSYYSPYQQYPLYPQYYEEESDDTMMYVVMVVVVLVGLYLVFRPKSTTPDDDYVPPQSDPSIPSCEVDPNGYYMFYNPDVQGDPKVHWDTVGYREGRTSCWPAPSTGTPTVRQHTDRLASDGIGGLNRLEINEAVYSPNRQYYLTIDAAGKAMIIEAATGKIKWYSKKSSDKGGTYLELQNSDGNLVIYAPNRKPVWDWDTSGKDRTPADLYVRDDGKLQLTRRRDGKKLKVSD